MTCGILVPWSGIESMSLAMRVQSPNHWIAREFSLNSILFHWPIHLFLCLCQRVVLTGTKHFNIHTAKFLTTFHVRTLLFLTHQPMQGRRPQFDSWVRKICWRRDRLPTPVFLGFPCGSAGKESTCNTGDLGSIPGLGRSPGEGKGYSLQYSGLENPMNCHMESMGSQRVGHDWATFTSTIY